MFWYSKKHNKKYYYKHTAMSEDPDVEFMMGEEYDKHDWTAEPEGSWEDILKNHAQKIRDTHGYLRLWYSGGSDSQTILNAFVKNGIHIDEIAMVRLSPTNNFNSPGMEEINAVAIPQIREIAKDIPNTKIKIYDVGYDQYANWFKNHFDLNQTNVSNFRIFWSSNAHKLIPGINDHKNVGNLTGVEKPRLGSDEKGVHWYFVDESLANHIVSPDEEDHQVMFFMDPIVHAKQCYMVKNHNKFNGSTVDTPDYFLGVCRDKLFINFSHGKTIIGPNSSPKALMDIDDALTDPKSKHLVDEWRNGLFAHGVDLKHFNNNDVMLGLVGILSKKYYLA